MNSLKRRIEALERAALPQTDSCGLTDEETDERLELLIQTLRKNGSLVETAEGFEVGPQIPSWEDREFVLRLAEILTKAKSCYRQKQSLDKLSAEMVAPPLPHES